MSFKTILFAVFFLSSLVSCRSISSSQLEANINPSTRRPPFLPEPSRAGGKIPWGGSRPEKWRPEAIIANGASWLMNEAWAQPNVVDVVIAVPGKYEIGWPNPYDDGQSNAMMHFNQWNHTTPPMMAALLQKSDGSRQAVFWFAKEYTNNPQFIEVMSPALSSVRAKLNIKRLSSGAFSALWDNPPKELGWTNLWHKEIVFVRPGPNFSDWLPIYFRMPVAPATELVKTLPANQRQYADGKNLLDREGLVQKNPSAPTPFHTATQHSFASHYNTEQNGVPYTPDFIHGQFKKDTGPITAVGQGWTWVAKKDNPFKILYTCFARRHPEGTQMSGKPGELYNEATAPNGGVVSGGGWHVIGEVNANRPDWFASETIINDVEIAPIMVAGGFENPGARLGVSPPSGTFAYGLSDVATLRWLWPGEAFVTVSSKSQKNYHWFFFDFDREVCTEEWVYNCVDAERNGVTPLKCE